MRDQKKQERKKNKTKKKKDSVAKCYIIQKEVNLSKKAVDYAFEENSAVEKLIGHEKATKKSQKCRWTLYGNTLGWIYRSG